ncbi:hypothetical protein Ssi03_18020 [Sphaerisporangium siamense]|nr:hypothetical protein Ssi03_18020 [Sphaerisporangium siamense]
MTMKGDATAVTTATARAAVILTIPCTFPWAGTVRVVSGITELWADKKRYFVH